MLDHNTATALLAGLDGLRRDLEAGLARSTAAAVEAATHATARSAGQAIIDGIDRMKASLAGHHDRTRAAIDGAIRSAARPGEYIADSFIGGDGRQHRLPEPIRVPVPRDTSGPEGLMFDVNHPIGLA